MIAVVVRGAEVRTASAPGYPTVLWKDRAEMPCGCAVLIGYRIDVVEPALLFTNCGEDGHFDLMVLARDSYAREIEAGPKGDDVQAVQVACQLLSETFNRPGG